MNKEISKIYIASDHNGVGLKLYLTQMLTAMGYSVENLGTDNPEQSSDYPEITKRITDALLTDVDARGIVMCGFGGGVQIAANRFRHIRCTRVCNPEQARHDRIHNDTNVIAFASEDIDLEIALLCVRAFLETPFDAAERRVRRIKQIS